MEQQPKASGSKKSRQGAGAMQSSKKRSISAPNPSAASQRKSYDWLTPSMAGASHHGPEGRHDQGIPMPHLGWPPRNADGELLDDPSGGAGAGAGGSGPASKPDARQSAEARRRSHKRRREGDPPGPGKAWRKGLGKKWVSLHAFALCCVSFRILTGLERRAAAAGRQTWTHRWVRHLTTLGRVVRWKGLRKWVGPSCFAPVRRKKLPY